MRAGFGRCSRGSPRCARKWEKDLGRVTPGGGCTAQPCPGLLSSAPTVPWEWRAERAEADEACRINLCQYLGSLYSPAEFSFSPDPSPSLRPPSPAPASEGKSFAVLFQCAFKMSLIRWSFGPLAALLARHRTLWPCCSLAPCQRPKIRRALNSP